MEGLENKHICVSESRNGLGVFAKRHFYEGETILTFRSRSLDVEEISGPLSESYEALHCLQIGKQEYMGASGWIDDFLNHSCYPNAGIKQGHGGFILTAIRDIGDGDEITFDYSTHMDEGRELQCNCGALNCRKLIRDLKCIPTQVQSYYRELDVVGEFIPFSYAPLV